MCSGGGDGQRLGGVAVHHPTIGWKSDIEHVPIAKLREFYDTFYWPNNATVTVIGDISPPPR